MTQMDKPTIMRRYLLYLTLLVAGICSSCIKNKIAATDKSIAAGRYGSEFPSANASDEIEKITHSVKKVYSVSSYTTYQFKREAKITGYHLHAGTYKKDAWGVISTNETVFGTAIIIGFRNSQVALLTCSHVVRSPDTLVSYFEPTAEDPLRYIQSFSLKEKQENWVKELSSCGSFTVLASDISEDIALLGKKCESLTDTVEPFPYLSGHATELGWGSFVYIFGYPMGSQVITKGIVSLAPKRPMGEFSIDALLNKGYSGGIILALRNGVPNFEMVGMVKTVHSSREEFLKPASDQQRTPDWLPYTGEVFVGKNDNIQYGLNAVVPIESILGFYMKNRNELMLMGYNLDHFFLPSKP
jgi:hypothetical protein